MMLSSLVKNFLKSSRSRKPLTYLYNGSLSSRRKCVSRSASWLIGDAPTSEVSMTLSEVEPRSGNVLVVLSEESRFDGDCIFLEGGQMMLGWLD